MKIDLQNYEEWMVAFIDGELNLQEEATFFEFLNDNPSLKAELDAFTDTKIIEDETIVFEGKADLYKKESALVLLKKSWPLAATLFIILLAYIFLNPNEKEEPVITKEIKVQEKSIQAPKENIATLNPSPAVQEPLVIKKKSTSSKKKLPVLVSAPSINKPNNAKEIPEDISAPQNIDIEKVEKPKSIVAKEEKQKLKLPTKNEEIVTIEKKQTPPLAPTTDTKNAIEEYAAKKVLVVISEETHPIIHEKINEVVTQVGDKIEKIKQLKRTPITFCLGKRKLFTINN